MLEVVGNAVGHVILARAAADVLAPAGSSILPPLVAPRRRRRDAARDRTQMNVVHSV